MRLYYIRHGQSSNNALYEQTGSSDGRSDDPHLTANGLEQARRMARFLRDNPDPADGASDERSFGITHLYCSLMHRSVATANEASRALNLPLIAWPDWHESGGIYLQDLKTQEFMTRPGLKRSEILREFPDILLPDWVGEDGWWNQSFETEDAATVRGRRVFQELIRRHGNTQDRVAIVSHGSFYNSFLAAALGVDQIKPIWFRMYNTAISRFDFEPEWATMVYHNLFQFLPGELLT